MERTALQVPVDGATMFCSVRGAGPVILFPSLVGTRVDVGVELRATRWLVGRFDGVGEHMNRDSVVACTARTKRAPVACPA